VKVNLIGAGRTDAGVHALGQVANFRIDHRLEPSQYRDALNYYLPDDIIIKSAAEVMPDFNARRSAIFRRYRYLIGFEKSAIHRNLRWDCRKQLDSVRLNEAAAELLGEHDFTSFCVVASRKESNICRIDHPSAWWRREKRVISAALTTAAGGGPARCWCMRFGATAFCIAWYVLWSVPWSIWPR
jgi:tRNA pseudouridine38-40 synthase